MGPNAPTGYAADMDSGRVLWLIAATSIALAGLALAMWALRGEPARGRRRCPRCWYDMSGTAGLQCPECGRVAGRESALRRARPRWMHAGAGAVLIALGLFASRPVLFTWNTWAGVLPLSAWRIWVPVMDPDAVASIEADGASAVLSGSDRADHLRAAYRVMLILDGRADPGKAPLPPPPPPPDDLDLDLGSYEFVGPPRSPWGRPWPLDPSDVELVLQTAQAINSRAMTAIAMPSVHRVLRDITAPVDHRVECLRVIRAVEGVERFNQLAAELAASDPVAVMRGSALWLMSERLPVDDERLGSWVAAALDEDARIRCYAIRTLRASGKNIWDHPGTLRALSAALSRDDVETRRCAIETFVVWGAKHARGAVEDIRCVAESDPDPHLREVAASLLRQIEDPRGPL